MYGQGWDELPLQLPGFNLSTPLNICKIWCQFASPTTPFLKGLKTRAIYFDDLD